MELQTSMRVLPLGVARLAEIGTILKDACGAMQRLNIPATVIHNDLSRGNILLAEDHCVFTDWCEASVGNPFLALQHLLLLLPRGEKDAEVGRFDVMCAYKQRWLDSLTPRQIDQAFALMPVLAMVSHLYGRGDWLRSTRRAEPQIQGYARSLARHMDRATRNPSLLEALCH
jgi:aminoglycoside phosphotransferase (APT) family kinase protein